MATNETTIIDIVNRYYTAMEKRDHFKIIFSFAEFSV